MIGVYQGTLPYFCSCGEVLTQVNVVLMKERLYNFSFILEAVSHDFNLDDLKYGDFLDLYFTPDCSSPDSVLHKVNLSFSRR